MFSESIQKLIGTSSLNSAQERVSQIEGLVTQYTKSLQTIQPPADTTNTKFSDFLNVKPVGDLKFKLANPIGITKAEIEDIVSGAAKKYNIDKNLILSIIKQESGFNPNAVSKCGAMGLMQLMPTVARSFGVSNALDPVKNVEAGTKLISGLLKKYRGNLILALAAYNAGSGSVDKYNGVPPFAETQNYVKSILANYMS